MAVAAGYATHRLPPAWRALPLPDAVSDDMAAASLLRALTVQMLFTWVRPMQPGETVVVHAATGGLDRMVIAHGRRLGLRMIDLAGGPEKEAELACEAGADLVIDRRAENPVAAVQAATDGSAHLVIDAIGGDMLARSFGMRPAASAWARAWERRRGGSHRSPSVVRYGPGAVHRPRPAERDRLHLGYGSLSQRRCRRDRAHDRGG